MGSKLAWAKKYRKWAVLAALVIIAIIAIRPMFCLGVMGFLWVMFLLVVAVGVLVVRITSYFKAIPAAILIVLLVFGIISGGILLYESAPELSAGEVKTIMNDYYRSMGRPMSAEYRGEGIWEVRVISIQGARYLHYNERTGALLPETVQKGEQPIKPFKIPRGVK